MLSSLEKNTIENKTTGKQNLLHDCHSRPQSIQCYLSDERVNFSFKHMKPEKYINF